MVVPALLPFTPVAPSSCGHGGGGGGDFSGGGGSPSPAADGGSDTGGGGGGGGSSNRRRGAVAKSAVAEIQAANQAAAATPTTVEESVTSRERRTAAQWARAVGTYCGGGNGGSAFDGGECFDFENYASTYFASRSAGCCRGALPVRALARFSRSPLPARGALTTAAECAGASADAASLFRAVQMYMGDAKKSPGSTTDVELAKRVVSLALQVRATGRAQPAIAAARWKCRGGGRGGKSQRGAHADTLGDRAMRDECYCQLVKQTRAHPAPCAEVRGWRLLYLVSVAFVPSEELLPYVLCHVEAAAEAEGKVISLWVQVAAAAPAGTGMEGRGAWPAGAAGSGAADAQAMREIADVASLVRARLLSALFQGARGTPPSSIEVVLAESAGKRHDSAPVFYTTLQEIAFFEEKFCRCRWTPDATISHHSDSDDGQRSNDDCDFGGGSDGVVDSPLITPIGAALASAPLPQVLASLLSWLNRSGALHVEGVFRIRADAKELDALVVHIRSPNCDFDAALRRARPHAAADLLKIWLSRLALPVIPARLYWQCLESEPTLIGMTRALAPLPPLNRMVLDAVVRTAASVVQASGGGGGSSSNAGNSGGGGGGSRMNPMALGGGSLAHTQSQCSQRF